MAFIHEWSWLFTVSTIVYATKLENDEIDEISSGREYWIRDVAHILDHFVTDLELLENFFFSELIWTLRRTQNVRSHCALIGELFVTVR